MTSTNDGKEVKSYQTSGPKGKSYFIELYKSLEARLNESATASERTKHLCDAWRRVHSLCQHSAPTTHSHLVSWLQRHTARTVLQNEWRSPARKDDRASLEEAINVFIVESRTAAATRADGCSPPWEVQLVARGEWFKRILDHPWKHPVLNCLLNPDGTPPTDDEVLEWLKEERGVTFVMRLQTLVAEKQCDDIAVMLATAVMGRVRSSAVQISDIEQAGEPKDKPEIALTNFEKRLKEEAGFTVDVLEMLTDIEFVLLHKRDSSRCITLAKQTPLRTAYQLIERLQSRVETSPREKRLWKNSKEVAVLIAQVVIARCMVVPQCAGGARSALYCCARSLARLVCNSRLPSAAAALAAPAPTAAHLHTLAAAVDAQLAQKNDASMKPFVCELYVRAITAGMNELERLKLKTEKDTEARLMEQTLSSWFVQLGAVLACSDRVKCECALTAFSVHPSPQMYERIKAAPALPSIHLDSVEQASTGETNPEFGSWASDSRSSTNFVKTSQTLNMKARQNQANVLSTAILNEGEALGLSPELCQDITVLLSGPRVKTLSWDMDRELLLENCRAYLERTHGGTKAVTTELKYLNLNPADFQYLPEEDEDENNIYYGIEKGYEHLVEHEPQDIWEEAYEDFDKANTNYSSDELHFIQAQRKKKNKKAVSNSDEDDPLSFMAETKRKEKKERPHSKERSKEKKKVTDPLKKVPGESKESGEIKIPGDPLEIKEGSQEKNKDKPKRVRKKKEKVTNPSEGSLAGLIGLKVAKTKKKSAKKIPHLTDSICADSQGISSIKSNSEDNVLYDGLFSMDEMKSRGSQSSDSMGLHEFPMPNERVGIIKTQTVFNRPQRPASVSGIRIASQSPNKSHSYMSYSPAPYKSPTPSDYSRNNSSTLAKQEVKSSISKLLEFRRLNVLEAGKKPNAIMRPEGSIAIDNNISPKAVTIPEIPKSYISKQQSEKLTELKQKVDDIMKHRKNTDSAIPSPVIQYASKNFTNPGRPSDSYYDVPCQYNKHQMDRMTPSSSSNRCFSTPPPSDRFLDSVNLISIYDKNEPSYSRNYFPGKTSPYSDVSQDRQSNCDMSDLNYQEYLHELRKKNTFNQYAEKTEPKKAMKPINRVTPVVPNMKSEHKPQHGGKQMPQKKPDGSLNTFSRLSYYKNKQTDMRNKTQDMPPQNLPHTVGSLQSQRSDKQISPSNDVQTMTGKYEKPQTKTRDHPMLTNMLQSNSSRPQNQQKPVLPQQTILSEKDQNDLLLLLRQQSSLNNPHNSPSMASCCKPTPITQNSALASCSIMITSSTDTIYNSHPSVMPSNPNLMHNSHPSVMPSNPNLMPLNHQIGKPIETNKTVNESKMINVLSTSIIKPADSKNGPKPVNTKKPTGQEKSKKTEGKGQKQIAAKPVPSALKTPEEWENVMNAILKQKTPCRGPNALDMTLNKSSFEKAFEESLRKPPALFMSPNSCSAQKNISIIEYNHQNFVKNTESMATSSSTSETIKNKEKKSRSLLKNTKPPSQPTMKSKLKISANTANMIEKLKEKNKVEATIEKLMQQNHIEINIKNANITQIDILEKALKQSNIETPKLVTQQRNVTPTIDVQQSSFEVPKKVVKQNPVVIPKKDVKQVVEPKKEANQGVEILKKIHPEVQMKQFTHAGPKQDDPFISGIPNSDYDLLDELIDDDLRKEIGELSSDEESYNVAAQGCLKDNKTDKKTASFVYNNPLNDIVTKHPLNDVAKAPPVISARPSFARKSNQHRPNKKEPTLTKMSPARPALHKPVMCLNATNVKNVTTHIVSKPTQTCTYNANVLHNSQITVEPNIYVPRPVPVQNVVLLPSDLMYEGYSTVQTHVQAVKNIATNSYMTVNNAPCVNQTNQFTAPLVNSLIIASAVSHVPSDTTLQSKPVTKVTQSRNSSANSELLQPTNSAIAQGNIVVDDNKLDAKASSSKSNHVIQNDVQKKLETKADLNISKSGERKVLKEVQEKHADANNDYTKRTQKVSAKDLNTQADQERVRKKRMDILNRKICHFSGIQTIALSYSPLQLSIQKVKKDVDAVDKKVTEEEDLPTNQNGLQELNNEVQSPATPDSYKENKNETSQVRRILLRSSNKPKNKIITPTMASKQSLDKKLKGPPAVYLDTPNKIPSKNDQINTETNNKKKPVLKIVRNKSVTTSKDTKNKETKTKGTRTLKVPKNNKLNNISSTIENPAPNQDFDIEAELLGSTIPKIIPTDLDSSNPTEVGSAKTKDEDIFVTYMLSAKKYADSLPIQVDELQQGKDLTDTKTTKSSELLDSLKPSIPDKEEPESLPIKEGQLQQGKYLTVNKTTKYSGDSFKATIFEKEKAESVPTLEDELEHGKDLTVNKTTKPSKQLESFRTTKESSEITEIDSNTYKTEQSIKTNDHLVKTTDASILAEDISGETSVTIKEKYENINDKVVAETIDKVNEFLYESTKSNENNDVMISNQVNGQDSNIISKELSPIESVESIKSYENNNVMISNPVNGPDTNTISKELSTIKNINFVGTPTPQKDHVKSKKEQPTTMNAVKYIEENSAKADHATDDVNRYLNTSLEIVAPQAAASTVKDEDDDDIEIVDNAPKIPSPDQKAKLQQSKSINDSIVIEHLHTGDNNDPLKKSFRITMGNRKTYVGTISGSVNIETILDDPYVKSQLMSQFEQPKKLYSLKLNVNKNASNGIKIFPTRKIQQEITPLETVSLLSDDEEEDSLQVLETEYGNYKINSIDHGIFTKHQNKFKLKSFVPVIKLSLEEENAIKRRSETNLKDDASLNINNINEECVIIVDDDTINLENPSGLVCCDKLEDINILSAIPSKYVEGIFSDIENILAPLNKKPQGEPIVLIDDSSNDSLDLNQKPKPIEKIDELKNMLLKDLGVVHNISKSTDDVQVTWASEAIDLTNDPAMEPTDYCSFEAQIDNKEDYQKIMNRKYFVKLVRCDYMVNQPKSELIEVEDYKSDESDVAIPAPVSRSGSFSILEDFPVVDDNDKISEYGLERSSPVMEVYDIITSLEGKLPTNRSIHKMSVDSLKCDSEWMNTKKTEHLHCLSDLRLKRDMSSQSLGVPKLATLILTFIQKGDLVNKYNSLTRLHSSPKPIKRKSSKPSLFPIAKIPKLEKIPDKPHSRSVHDTLSYPTEAKVADVCNTLVTAATPTYCETLSYPTEAEIDVNNTIVTAISQSSVVDEYANDVTVSGDLGMETSQSETPSFKASEYLIDKFSSPEKVLDDYGLNKYANLECNIGLVTLKKDKLYCSNVTKDVVKQIVDSKSSSDAVERLIYSDIDDEGFLTKSYATVHSEIQAENISESEEVIGDVFLVPKICEGTFEKYVGENQSMDQLEVLITSTGCEKTDLGINIEIQKTDEPVDTTFTDKTNSKQATDSFETQMDDKHYFPDKFVNESINVQEPEDTESSKMTNEEEHSDITTAKLEKESTNSIPVENNSVQLQNDPKNKSTDTFFDALNEMFGDSGPMDINNVVVTKHEPKKALCISNEQNESCIAKNNEQKETCDLVIEKSIESRDIESAKMSKLEVRIINTTMKLDENSAQEVKQPDKDTTTKKENHAINNTTHLPQTTDEIDVALKKMFGKPKDTNFIDVSENVVIESCEYISTNNICTMWNDENLVLSAADDYNHDARNTLREELSPMEDYDSEILVVDLPNDEKNNIKTIPTLDCTHHVKESVENKVEQNLKPGFKKAIDVAVAAKGIEIESDISAEKCDSSMNITINNEDGASSKLSSQNTIGNAEDLKQQDILDNTNLVLDASLNVKLSDQDNEIKMFEDNTKQTMDTQDMKEIEENSGGIDNKRKYILDANLESDVCLKLETDDQYVEIKQKLNHDNIVHTLDTHDMKEIEKNNVVDNLKQKDILDKAHLEQDCSLKLETADEEIKIEDEIESPFANYCINIDYEKRVSNEFNDKNLILDASLNVEISDQDNVFKILDTIKTMDTLDLKEIQENVIDNLKRKDILDANFESEVSLKQTADQDIEIKKELLRDNIVPTLDAHDSKEIEKNNVVDNLQRKHILNKGNLESDGILKVETHDEELKIEDEIESTENTNIEKRVSNELNAQNNLDKYLVLTRKEVPVVGIENKDPDFETRYAFSMLNDVPGTYEINSQTNESKESTSNYCENEIIENTKLVVPKHTYAYTSNSLYNEMVRRSSRNIKRKKDMSDIKTTVKKYRKGKNIDYPKISAAAIADLAYAKEYKRIIDYCSTIKFSYARPFHIESIDVGDMLKAWPIQNCHSVEVKDSNNIEELLYTDAEDTENAMAITDPLIQTLNEEIVNGDNVNNYNSIDINETNFKMGFGEMSGRVIKKIETGITKLSAATLSDVKQYQPFSIPDESKVNPNLAHEIETQRVKFSHFMNLINVKEKLQSVFKKTAVELTKEFLKDKKYAMNESQLEFPFGLTSTEFMEVPSIESIVNVVQGQLPVSASAQNPVTCDPRVTHVSDASPSQCSDNSPGEDSVAIMATEYTELTTANITLPSVQEYGQPHQSPHSHEQNSPGTDNDINESTPSLSIVKIELVEEETSQENQENEVLGNDFSPLPHNNVEYSFEDTSNNMFNTSANADHTSTNTDNTSNNNMFNKTTNLDNTFTNVFNNSTNMDNAYMDNTPSSMESTYTNMDKASISMYSTSSNLGNSTTEVDNTANMDDASPNISLVTKTNVNNTATNIDNASGSMDSNYTNVYAPMGSDSSDISNTPTNVGNTAPNMDSSPINLGNRRSNMITTHNIENSNMGNTAYDYTYENIEDYAANIENNNNSDNYSTNVDNFAASAENYSSNAEDYTSNVESYVPNDENYPTDVENYASNVENYSRNIESYATNVENYGTNMNNTSSNVDNNLTNIDKSKANMLEDPQPQDLSMGNSSQESKICNTFEGNSQENGKSKSDQIAHAMNAAGISSETVITSGADELVNLMTQGAQVTANNFSKSTPINVMTLQHALAQVLPPPLNQTSTSENQIPNNPVTQQVLHIVQGTNAQTVINKPNGTHLLHILQNKSNPVANGLSLVDTGLQQGGNQLIHIVNNGNQNNAQFLKRVNLLTNLTNAQGSNEQKMIQFVCKSADGKSIQLNAGHQRSMVLRLHPTSVQTAPKPTDPQDLRASTSAVNSENSPDPNQEIKSRSVYEENYAQFIQNSAPTSGSSATICQEKATSLPKFNQVFGKQSYQENQNEINQNGLQENTECAPEENNAHLEQPADVNNPPLLVRNAPPETTQAQPNPVQQIKQTISPMNIHTTMHGGVIYTRQIPVNIGGGQTINLITVPSTELTDDLPQKQQTGGTFVNQEGEQSSIIKLVPHHTPNVSAEENKVQASSNETNHTPQPQPVLTQMRIKLPMLSKGPHLVPGARLVRPSFFQIQRNVIGGTNQPVYQQLVLTTAPSLGQSIRLPAQQPHSSQSPQAQPILVQTAQHPQPSPHIPVQQVQHAPSSQHAQSAKQAHSAPQTPQPQSVQPDHTKPINEPDSELSTLTLEQLREFDMVLEQVKERSVQPTPSTTPSTPVLPKPAPADSTDGPALATTSVSESTQQVIYSVEKQPTNVVSYVNRKSTITSATTSFVRSPDSSGIVETPSSSTQVQITHTVTSKSTTADGGSAVVAHSKKKKKKKSSSSTTAIASLGSPTKTNSLKPQEDEQTTQRILYILAEYKEQVENSPDKNKPAPRRRNQFPPTTGSKRKRSHCSSRASCRREGVEMSPIHGENGENGEDSLITLGSEDSSCGTTFSECTDCQESHSPEESPTKVVRRLTFEQETTTQITQTRTIPQRNVIVGDGQTITVARTTTATTAKPTTTVLMPANYLVPVSMIKGGQQIAIMTNRGPKILVGAGETNAGALLFQRLIGPGLKPVLTRPGVRHIRLPATALHNLQTFNIQTTPVTQVQPPDNTAQEASTPAPPDLVDTRAMSSPWHDREARDKPERGPSPDCTEPWNLPSSSIADDYGYEEIVRTDNMERTVLDAIPDRYSPDMEAQRIFDKMFDVDSKKSMYDSPRCGYDIDTSDGDDKPYPQVVQQRKDGRHHRVTHVSTAALRHKYAILEHELRLQKSLSEECEDLGVDSPSASDLFPEADILFGAPSPAHEQTIDQCNTPPPIPMPQIPQPDLDDQIATDQLLTHETRHEELDLNLDDVGEIVTVGEDGVATIPSINAEEFAKSHPNTTFHTEPEDGEITIAQPPFTIAQGIKARHITFHANRGQGTVMMAPQTTVISQATVSSNEPSNTVKFTDIDNMINSMPCPQPPSIPSVLKEPGMSTRPLPKFDGLKDPSIAAPRPLSKFDSLLTDSKVHHLSSNNSARQIVQGTQVIRRLRYDEKINTKSNTRFHFEEPRRSSVSDEVKMRNDRAIVESMGDNASSPGNPELFWDSTTTERHERRFHFSESEKVTKSPFDELLNDSSAYGPHTRLDSVIKAARPERTYERTSFEGISVSGSDESRPLRTYPPKRAHNQHTQDMERHFTLKTTTTTTHHHELDRSMTTKTTHHHDLDRTSKKTMPRCQESEGRRRTGRGLVKRGCSCCNGSSAPPKKRARPKKPPTDFTPNS